MLRALFHFVLAGLLITSAIVLVATNAKEIREINIFAVVLVIQSLPFIAAVALAVIERTQFNEFAYWRTLDARFAELLGRRAPMPMPIANVITTVPAQIPLQVPLQVQVPVVAQEHRSEMVQ